MVKIISAITLNIFSRCCNLALALPVSLTFSVTYRCNFRCKTCNIWQDQKSANELGLSQIEKVFRSLGRSLYWITLDGGEPFLRKDLAEVVGIIYENCKPAIINIPSNGSLPQETLACVKKILSQCKKSKVIVNLSLDHIEEKHDVIKDYSGSVKLLLETYHGLKGMNNLRLRVGFNTVISNYNIGDWDKILPFVRKLKPDSHLFEIAQLRDEFRNRQLGSIVPDKEDSLTILKRLPALSRINRKRFTGRALYAMRKSYYSLVAKTLALRRQIVPCFAGISSCYILPDGEVWACCNNAHVLGRLREFDFDFKRLWRQKAAGAVRRQIKKNKCFCIQSNANYLNMLHSPLYLPKLIARCLTNSTCLSSQKTI